MSGASTGTSRDRAWRHAADVPLEYNAVEILERNLPERMEKTALASAERTCTFGQIAAETNRVGAALLREGVRPGECVAILLPDSAEWVCAFFGSLKVGALALGLNTLLTPREHAFMLKDAKARVLIVHAALLAPLREELRGCPSLARVVAVGVVVGGAGGPQERDYAAWIEAEHSELESAPTHRDDPCTLNYTSGTTGEPKGIVHAHKDLPLCAQLYGIDVLGLREDDRTFAGAKLFFTFGLGGNLIFPWYAGASVVLMSGSPRVASNVLETVQRFRPTILFNAPTGYAMALAAENRSRYDMTSLRLCVSAGESLPEPIWRAWKAATGLDILDGIGSTENFHIFLTNRPGDIRPGSSGKPMAGYELQLVDDLGVRLPQQAPGALGNLWVKGETAALSYLHRYAESRRTFRGEWLVTGDKYSIDEDGYYWHAGRSDDMLKVGGLYVSPVEVEGALMGHAAVLECAVVGAEDRSGLVKPKAFVTLKPGTHACEDLEAELIEHCAQALAAYKRPRWIEFVSELPKTATGKTQRFKLRGQ